jgi:hypothetical protein
MAIEEARVWVVNDGATEVAHHVKTHGLRTRYMQHTSSWLLQWFVGFCNQSGGSLLSRPSAEAGVRSTEPTSITRVAGGSLQAGNARQCLWCLICDALPWKLRTVWHCRRLVW